MGIAMIERKKVYVTVNATHRADGSCRPNVIVFNNNRRFEIERVIKKVKTASTKVGGHGLRYTVSINGHEAFLFDEENGKWFVEAKA